MNHLNPTGLATWIARLALLLGLCAGLSTAQTNSGNYTFLLGSGFLCDPSDSSPCQPTAKATQGDSYEVSGAGIFDPQNKSVKATGTFAHKSARGNVLETGVWTASEVVNFVSYGIAPGALLHESRVWGPSLFGFKRAPMLSNAMPTGGLAVFRIHLLPISGAPRTAVLEVNCALGDVPRERSVEGIRVTLEGGGGEFSEEVGGHLIFLAMRPRASTPVKAPTQEVSPVLSELPPNYENPAESR